MNQDYVLPIDEIPLGVINKYEEYKDALASLFHAVRNEGDRFTESALELFNERLMDDGCIPDYNEIILKIHSDQVLEMSGSIALN